MPVYISEHLSNPAVTTDMVVMGRVEIEPEILPEPGELSEPGESPKVERANLITGLSSTGFRDWIYRHFLLHGNE